jgi:fluoroquinolone resistance protein
METFQDTLFEKQNYTTQGLINMEFDHCRFSQCDFSNASLAGSRFENCLFENCNMALVKLNKTN